MRSVHAGQLDRWLGSEAERISRAMQGWYGPPIAVCMPGGTLLAMPDGDFRGRLDAGRFTSLADVVWGRLRRAVRRATVRGQSTAGMGFTSLSDLISEATTGGKRQDTPAIVKQGSLAVSAAYASLWNVGYWPVAAGAPANIPGGAAPTNATSGSLLQTNAGGGDTLHMVSAVMMGSAAPNSLLVYDRIFHAANVLHTTTGNQAVSGVPSRYATTTSPGNFCFLEVTGALGTTAHNATISYTDEAGAAAEAGSAQAVTVSSAATRIPTPQWYYALNSPDRGCRTVTNVAFSAVSSGTSNIVQGHPLFWIPCPVANVMTPVDGINSMFNLVQLLDNACVAFLELKGVATATTYTGQIVLVSG